MRDKTILINALRAAADKAEREPRCYLWMSVTQCNCGLVAQEILGGRTPVHHALHSTTKMGGWEGVGREIAVCTSSGLPLNDLISKLVDAGFEADDFGHLEDLSREQIRERAGLPEDGIINDREDRTAFIRYARAWADILEEKTLVDLALGK
jgi:hypothetical protein